MKFIEFPQEVFKSHPENPVVALLGVYLEPVSLLLGPEVACVRPVSVPLILAPRVAELNQSDLLIVPNDFIEIEDAVGVTHNKSIRFFELRNRRVGFGASCHKVSCFECLFDLVVDFVGLLGAVLCLFQLVEARRGPGKIPKSFTQNSRVNFVVAPVSFGVSFLNQHRPDFILSFVWDSKNVGSLPVDWKIVINYVLVPLAVDVEPHRVYAILVYILDVEKPFYKPRLGSQATYRAK